MTREEELEKLKELAEGIVKKIRRKLESNEAEREKTIGNLMDNWISNVRTYDGNNPDNPFFRNKPRGYGQSDGSTDGRLRRKLMMELAKNYATDENETADNEELNRKIAGKLGNFLPSLTSQPLKKALYLTKEKLRDPLGYKQRHARLVPFGNTGWVKASHRFAKLLPLMNAPTISDLNQRLPPKEIPNFGPSEDVVNGNKRERELIEDVGQELIGECFLQSGASSLSPSAVKGMFDWSPSYEGDGVTVRLYSAQNNPVYMRLQKNQLWHDKSDHKAVWPAALSAAWAKLGLRRIREERKRRGTHYDKNTGVPLYRIEDVNGYPITETASVLTGDAIEEHTDLTKENEDRKRRIASRLWNEMQKRLPIGGKVYRGVVRLADNPNHAQVWFKKPSNTTGTFGNPHAEQHTHPRGKIFNDDLSKILSATFFRNPDTAYDRYVNRTVNPKWQERKLGNLSPRMNTSDNYSEL
jgi:hypothetical protein